MKVGDLVKVKACPGRPAAFDHWKCECFFCTGNSNRIGVVTSKAARNSWCVMFDCGSWRLDIFDEARGDVKVINESR